MKIFALLLLLVTTSASAAKFSPAELEEFNGNTVVIIEAWAKYLESSIDAAKGKAEVEVSAFNFEKRPSERIENSLKQLVYKRFAIGSIRPSEVVVKEARKTRTGIDNALKAAQGNIIWSSIRPWEALRHARVQERLQAKGFGVYVIQGASEDAPGDVAELAIVHMDQKKVAIVSLTYNIEE